MGQGPTVLAVGADGGCLDLFSVIFHFSYFSLSLGDGRYSLKYCLKGTLSPKQPSKQFLGNKVFAYSATSLQQPPMGQQKSGCCREVTAMERSNI